MRRQRRIRGRIDKNDKHAYKCIPSSFFDWLIETSLMASILVGFILCIKVLFRNKLTPVAIYAVDRINDKTPFTVVAR